MALKVCLEVVGLEAEADQDTQQCCITSARKTRDSLWKTRSLEPLGCGFRSCFGKTHRSPFRYHRFLTSSPHIFLGCIAKSVHETLLMIRIGSSGNTASETRGRVYDFLEFQMIYIHKTS